MECGAPQSVQLHIEHSAQLHWDGGELARAVALEDSLLRRSAHRYQLERPSAEERAVEVPLHEGEPPVQPMGQTAVDRRVEQRQSAQTPEHRSACQGSETALAVAEARSASQFQAGEVVG